MKMALAFGRSSGLLAALTALFVWSEDGFGVREKFRGLTEYVCSIADADFNDSLLRPRVTEFLEPLRRPCAAPGRV